MFSTHTTQRHTKFDAFADLTLCCGAQLGPRSCLSKGARSCCRLPYGGEEELIGARVRGVAHDEERWAKGLYDARTAEEFLYKA
jgi:hypothetical protein